MRAMARRPATVPVRRAARAGPPPRARRRDRESPRRCRWFPPSTRPNRRGPMRPAPATHRASGSRIRASGWAWWPARRAPARSTWSSPPARGCSPPPSRPPAWPAPSPPPPCPSPTDRPDEAGAGARSPVKLARVTLRKRLARAIRGGHPWVYREALVAAPQLPDGTTVLVVDPDDRPLACGFWDADSPIAVRVLGEVRQAELPAEIERRIGDALARRLESIDRR